MIPDLRIYNTYYVLYYTYYYHIIRPHPIRDLSNRIVKSVDVVIPKNLKMLRERETLVRFPNPLAFSIQAGTLPRKTRLVNDIGSHEFNNITLISLN